MMMFGYVKKERFDALEKRVKELEYKTADHGIYDKRKFPETIYFDEYSFPKPVVEVSLWQAIHALIKHGGLEINGVKSSPATFTLDKVNTAKHKAP